MAYDISIAGNFNATGGNTYDLFMYVRRMTTDITNNRSAYSWEGKMRHRAGVNQRWSATPQDFGFTVGSQTFYKSKAPDMRGVSEIVIGSDTTGFFGHDANGYLNIGVRAWASEIASFGSADTGTVTFATDRNPRPPSAVQNLTVTATGPTTATLSFTQPANNGGAALTHFTIEVANNSAFNNSTEYSQTNGTRSLTGLDAGTTTYVRVRAWNAYWAGPWATDTAAQPSGLATAPRNPSVLNRTPASQTFDWDAPASYNGSSLSAYQVQFDTVSNFASPATVSAGTSLSVTRTDLAAGTLYYWRVRAQTTFGYGPWSATAQARTDDGLPAAPVSPAVSNQAPDTQRYSASHSGGTVATGVVTGYDIQRATNSAFTAGVVTVANGGLTLVVATLLPNEQYWWRSRAKTAFGIGPWSAVVTATTPTGLASAPLSLSLSAVTINSMKLDWAAPSTMNSGTFSRYEVQIATNSAFTTGAALINAGTARTITRTGLTPGDQYFYRVRAYTEVGAGPWSAIVSATTLTGIPSAPRSPALSGIGPKTTTAAWTAPAANNGSSVTGYILQRATNSSFTTGLVSYTLGNVLSHARSDLAPGTLYYWRVRAVTAVGQGDWSATVSAKTKSGAYVGYGGQQIAGEVYVGYGGQYVASEILVGIDNAFVSAG